MTGARVQLFFRAKEVQRFINSGRISFEKVCPTQIPVYEYLSASLLFSTQGVVKLAQKIEKKRRATWGTKKVSHEVKPIPEHLKKLLSHHFLGDVSGLLMVEYAITGERSEIINSLQEKLPSGVGVVVRIDDASRAADIYIPRTLTKDPVVVQDPEPAPLITGFFKG